MSCFAYGVGPATPSRVQILLKMVLTFYANNLQEDLWKNVLIRISGLGSSDIDPCRMCIEGIRTAI